MALSRASPGFCGNYRIRSALLFSSLLFSHLCLERRDRNDDPAFLVLLSKGLVLDNYGCSDGVASATDSRQ